MNQVVIVGAGQAGCWAAKTLRQYDFTGKVILLGDEPHPPYDRPPLSKKVLVGDAEPETTWYLSLDELAGLDIDFRPGLKAVSIDRTAQQLDIEGAAGLSYDKLIVATGARPRLLNVPGSEQAPIYYLRGIDDCLALQKALVPGRRIIVVGGGLIGLEVAAAARKLGCEAVVMEVAERVLARVAGPEVSRFVTDMHKGHGVDVVCGVMPDKIETGAQGCRIACKDGTLVEGDVIVAGIGVIPNSELASAAGLACEGGIWVDEFTRTEDANIHAAGDVTNHINPRLGRRMRLETWQNAQNQAIAAAKIICGREEPYDDTPWGWSDQYDCNLQMLGIPDSFDDAVMRGNPDDGAFSLFYLRDGKVNAMAAINAVRDVAVSRRLVASGTLVDAGMLADVEVPMKQLMSRD
ncbi:MAG: FAD-dependent oxidoreductase [Rhizobiales bacterium]|nr:FAD-dependent oxidoreductase [Hyphomicrobiales bacterium]